MICLQIIEYTKDMNSKRTSSCRKRAEQKPEMSNNKQAITLGIVSYPFPCAWNWSIRGKRFEHISQLLPTVVLRKRHYFHALFVDKQTETQEKLNDLQVYTPSKQLSQESNLGVPRFKETMHVTSHYFLNVMLNNPVF